MRKKERDVCDLERDNEISRCDGNSEAKRNKLKTSRWP